MANPTTGQVFSTQLKYALLAEDVLYPHGTEVLDTINDINTTEVGEEHVLKAKSQNAIINGISSGLNAVRNLLVYNANDLLKAANIVNNSNEELTGYNKNAIREYMDDNSIYVLQRGQTASVEANINSKAHIVQCTVDELGYPIQNILEGTHTLKCIEDQNGTKSPGREALIVEAGSQGDNFIESYEKPEYAEGKPLNIINGTSGTYLRNPMFNQFRGGGTGTDSIGETTITSIPNWTVESGSISDFYKTDEHYYRKTDSDYTFGYGLVVANTGTASATKTIKQKLNNVAFSSADPIYAEVYYYATHTAGNITLGLTIGAVETSTIVPYTEAGNWNRLQFPQNSSAYYKTFVPTSTADKSINIEVGATINAGDGIILGGCLVDDYGRIGNRNILAIAGREDVMAVDDDTATISCTYDSAGKRQKAYARLLDWYLPCTTVGTDALAEA